MSPFFNAFIVIYKDFNDPDGNTYIAQNPITLMTSAWYPTLDDLFSGIDSTPDEKPYKEDPIYLEETYPVHSYYLNGKLITLEQAKADYPELFI
jgi:hypothetical protein